MEKDYERPLIEIINILSDVVRTSTGKDPFDDDFTDSNLGKD